MGGKTAPPPTPATRSPAGVANSVSERTGDERERERTSTLGPATEVLGTEAEYDGVNDRFEEEDDVEARQSSHSTRRGNDESEESCSDTVDDEESSGVDEFENGRRSESSDHKRDLHVGEETGGLGGGVFSGVGEVVEGEGSDADLGSDLFQRQSWR